MTDNERDLKEYARRNDIQCDVFLGPGPNLRNAFEWQAWRSKYGPYGYGPTLSEAVADLKTKLEGKGLIEAQL